jgi:hypothetical protein
MIRSSLQSSGKEIRNPRDPVKFPDSPNKSLATNGMQCDYGLDYASYDAGEKTRVNILGILSGGEMWIIKNYLKKSEWICFYITAMRATRASPKLRRAAESRAVRGSMTYLAKRMEEEMGIPLSKSASSESKTHPLPYAGRRAVGDEKTIQKQGNSPTNRKNSQAVYRNA